MTKRTCAEAEFADLIDERGAPATKTKAVAKTTKGFDRPQPRRPIPRSIPPRASRTAQRAGYRHEPDRGHATAPADLVVAATTIRNGLRRGVDGIIEAAIEVYRVKRQKLVKHGQFTTWVKKEVGVNIRTAEWLINIAKDTELIKPCHRHALPPSIRTLYELTKIKPAQRRQLIANGIINRSMNREEAIVLRWQIEGGTRSNPEQNAERGKNRNFTPAPKTAAVVDACMNVDGGDVILAHIRSQELMREVSLQEFDQGVRELRQRLAKHRSRQS